MREQFVNLIVERLERDADAIAADFGAEKDVKTRYCAIDELLPEVTAREIAEAFPPSDEMRLLDSFREKKHTSKSLDKFDPLITDITFAFQDERVVQKVAELTGIKDAVGDPHLYAGGISAMGHGHFLNPHIDNSHDGEQKNYRVLNLLYYITPDWKPENGGNLELWDEEVKNPVEIPSLFNRLVLMSTNEMSWHSVNEVKADGTRRCISNYYFSPHSPNGHETTHVTYFMARPEQKLRRLVTKADSDLRTLVRKFKKDGLRRRMFLKGSPTTVQMLDINLIGRILGHAGYDPLRQVVAFVISQLSRPGSGSLRNTSEPSSSASAALSASEGRHLLPDPADRPPAKSRYAYCHRQSGTAGNHHQGQRHDQVNAVLWFRIVEASKAILEVVNYEHAVYQFSVAR